MKAILTFHSIDDSGSVLSYPVGLFRELLYQLQKKQIPVLDLDTLLDPGTEGGVVLTFDDGMRSVYANALPILKEYQASAHVFVTTSVIGSNQLWPLDEPGVPGFEMMDWGELEHLHEAGISIGAHTVNHPDMRKLSAEQVVEQCVEADSILEKRLGCSCDFFAYPFGYHNSSVRNYIRQHYKAAVTTELSYLREGEDHAALPRIDSYYLQSELSVKRIDSAIMRKYMLCRSLLRDWRGSQCRASIQ